MLEIFDIFSNEELEDMFGGDAEDILSDFGIDNV